MKVGADNKLELALAVILGVGALASVLYWARSGDTVIKPDDKTKTQQRSTQSASLINPLDPTLRLDLLDSAQSVKYEGKGRNIFRAGATGDGGIEKVNQGPFNPHKNDTPPPPPPGPVVPPINIKFFGMASHPGEQPRVFLSEGDSVFIAREGDVVDSRYKVVRISPQSVEIEDLLNNNKQTINISQG